MSHDLLDDLLVDVPRHVTPDPAAAWRAGNRRRVRTYAVEGLAVAAAVALVGLGLAQLHARTPVQPTGRTAKVDGHPSTVGWPRGGPELPARPGPMAGALEWSTDKVTGWSLIDASGRSWVVPGLDEDETFQPTLSDDGRWLGYLRADDDGGSTFVLRDLDTDQQREFPDLGSNRGNAMETYETFPQTPSFWSPDDSTLLVQAAHRDRGRAEYLLLGMAGDPVEVDVVGSPVGWQDDDHIVWLRAKGTVLITDRAGQVVERFSVPPNDWPYSQWSGRVSPDGTRLAVLDESSPGHGLQVVSLADGHIEQASQVDTEHLISSPVWQGDQVLLWDARGLVDPLSSERVVELSGHWPQDGFGMWAPDALAGPAHRGPGPLDWRYWPFLWWWKQLLGWLGGVVVVAGIVWVHRRDRRRLRAAA